MADRSNNSKFTGPLFIVGMPRSGTKLLRTLLSLHSRVRVATIETEFLPHWFANWQQFGDLSDFSAFTRFYRSVSKAPYFSYMKERGELIGVDTWFGCCDNFTAQGVFEALIRHDVGAGKDSDIIWGDKSPLYVWHLDLLKQHFPQALFVHVIRDVRDYCISINKAWGKNMIRAAQRWVDGVTAARGSGESFPEDYVEVQYEALLESPEQELKRICNFLCIEFEPCMLELTRPTENLGDAKGEAGIVKGNYGKYEEQLSPHLQQRIEAISSETLRALGYQVGFEGGTKRVPKLQMKVYQLLDGLNLVRAHFQQRGLMGALAFHYQHFRHSARKG